ncbi:class I adenylate-forming enzyme family protein [Rhodococcus koreensis]|uniref:class I adenylate-forming enzyme family protein n=1 Tax=Rhodococcus koreensis TaxID=99653 RepID=UPI0036720819
MTMPIASSRTRSYRPADTSTALWEETAGTVLARHARNHPGSPAVTEWIPDVDTPGGGRTRTLTYAEVYEAAHAAAAGLLSAARPGDRIALWAPNSADWLIFEYAAALAGVALVPLNPAFTDREAVDLLKRTRCVVVLTVVEFRGQDLLARAQRLAVDVPSLRRCIDLDQWREAFADAPAVQLPDVSPDDPYLIQFTSGTTGEPKAAVLNHRAALNAGRMMLPAMELDDGVAWCSPMPMHHIAGTVCLAMSALSGRGHIVLFPKFDPTVMLELIERTKASVILSVPTMLMALLDDPTFADRDLSSMQVALCGGSTVAPSLIRRAEQAIGCKIVNAYGQSEAPSAIQTRLDDTDEVKAFTIGRPLQHREAQVVDPGTNEVVQYGEAGELWLRSPLNMSGYFEDTGSTGRTVDSDGWLHTGDLCAMSPEGVISIRGRLREVIIRGGENIYPSEIEDVLLQHPAVANVAIVGTPDERWGEQVAAFVKFRDDNNASWSDLEEHVRQRISHYKIPRIWRLVEDYPLTPSGKVQKFRLQQQLVSENAS